MMTPLYQRSVSTALLLTYALTAATIASPAAPPTASEIDPFKRILSIEPGFTTFSEAVKLLGKAEKTESAKAREVEGVRVGGGSTFLYYPTRGIMLITPSDVLTGDSVMCA